MKKGYIAYNRNMGIIRVSDSSANKSNLIYIHNAVCELLGQVGGKSKADCDDKRSVISFSVDEPYALYLKGEIEDKIADIICVNYKYKYFKKNINPVGLNDFEYELLLTALISADIDDDKKYVINKIGRFDEYSVDGTFNFRMNALKEKWKDVAEYIPPYFESGQLKDFIVYLVKEKKGRRVFVEDDKVYDRHFNRLTRCFLTNGDFGDGYVIREVLLSGSGEVELTSPVNKTDEFYLKEYFGDKIFFRKKSF